jgi:hypothetical protein
MDYTHITIINTLSPSGWSKKWADIITKGPEYESCKRSWVEISKEAEHLSIIYSELQTRLLSQVCESITTWKSENYHKSVLSWKETKNAEEGFSKAQKPYSKRYDKGKLIVYVNLKKTRQYCQCCPTMLECFKTWGLTQNKTF